MRVLCIFRAQRKLEARRGLVGIALRAGDLEQAESIAVQNYEIVFRNDEGIERAWRMT